MDGGMKYKRLAEISRSSASSVSDNFLGVSSGATWNSGVSEHQWCAEAEWIEA